ncbi:uncharacterized protein LOC123988479 [Osmia bicornis bicornis]|uniref:uncharacterized protein LOC123988479 n=1 Tax=Osmia bicornis bicornis TaxID=1437191 RepID=UPI001EAEE196|nr:uncharacterized protein LOC123988479 [Osmia bicornis bicornis]
MDKMDCSTAERQNDKEVGENGDNHEQINQGSNEESQKRKEEPVNRVLLELIETYKKQNAELKKELKRLKHSRGARGGGSGRGGRGRGGTGRGDMNGPLYRSQSVSGQARAMCSTGRVQEAPLLASSLHLIGDSKPTCSEHVANHE